MDYLALGDATFCNAVSYAITAGSPVSNAYVVMAYQHLILGIKLSRSIAEDNPDKNMPQTIEEQIRFMEEILTKETSEIGRRRVE
jgi:hypothetical protein